MHGVGRVYFEHDVYSHCESARTVMVLVMVVCCGERINWSCGIVCVWSCTAVSDVGCGLKVDRYDCTLPANDLNDPACTEVGGVGVCATNGAVKPWLSDDEGTQYIWIGTAYLDLYIPNSVCVEAIVMTFHKPVGTNLPELTIEPSVPVNISSPPTPAGSVDTTVTFTQPYCRQTVRINMTQDPTASFILIQEVTLIEFITPGRLYHNYNMHVSIRYYVVGCMALYLLIFIYNSRACDTISTSNHIHSDGNNYCLW